MRQIQRAALPFFRQAACKPRLAQARRFRVGPPGKQGQFRHAGDSSTFVIGEATDPLKGTSSRSALGSAMTVPPNRSLHHWMRWGWDLRIGIEYQGFKRKNAGRNPVEVRRAPSGTGSPPRCRIRKWTVWDPRRRRVSSPVHPPIPCIYASTELHCCRLVSWNSSMSTCGPGDRETAADPKAEQNRRAGEQPLEG